MTEKIKVGIIGGSGFYEMPELKDPKPLTLDPSKLEFGKPTSDLVEGTIEGVPCVVMARHGPRHQFNPTEVNYRGNLLALMDAGVTHIIAATACGSLQADISPGKFVILDSFIDRTTKRQQTYHTQEKTTGRFGKVCHIPMHPSFCPKASHAIYKAAQALGMEERVVPMGTIVTIEGPRFSSRAESLVFKSWGADVINMTTVPEVVLAKELGISYAALAMVTDYDCWKDDEVAVDVTRVMATLKCNVENARRLIVETIKHLSKQDWTETIKENQALANAGVLSW